MEKSELLTKLIEYYENAIKEMPKKNWRLYISKKYLVLGICHTASVVFKENIFYKDWFDKYLAIDNSLLCDYVSNAKTRIKAIELLQIRVDVMKQELSTTI